MRTITGFAASSDRRVRDGVLDLLGGVWLAGMLIGLLHLPSL